MQGFHNMGFEKGDFILIEYSVRVKETGNLEVPLHLRNAPTKLMKELNYGTNYKYSHKNNKLD